MPLITETYYLSLTQDNRGILRLRCSQDDTLRTVNLKLYNNGSVFVIPSGISAYVSGVKQNGAVFSKSCTISQNRESVVFQLSSDITSVDGIIVAEIVLNDGSGGRLGASNFIIQVEKNPIRAGVVQDTETPIEYVNDFITQIQALTARVNNLITPNGDPSLAEVVDARISSLDNNTYQNLKARIDADIATLNTRKANKADVYTKAQVDTLLDNVEIAVDDEFSDESENPVQNKVVAGAISILQADLGALNKPQRLADGTDLDTVLTPGVYTLYATSSYINKPTADSEHGILEVLHEDFGDNTGRTFQRLTYTYKVGRTYIEIWVRTYSPVTSAWTPWVSATEDLNSKLMLLRADLDALIAPPRLDDNTDLDSVITSGVYTLYAASTYLNKPTQDGEHGILEVWEENYEDRGRIFQRLTYTYKAGRINSEIWVRSKSGLTGGEWTPWVISGGSGLTDNVKVALLACFRHALWVDEHGQDYYDTLSNALFPDGEPDERIVYELVQNTNLASMIVDTRQHAFTLNEDFTIIIKVSRLPSTEAMFLLDSTSVTGEVVGVRIQANVADGYVTFTNQFDGGIGYNGAGSKTPNFTANELHNLIFVMRNDNKTITIKTYVDDSLAYEDSKVLTLKQNEYPATYYIGKTHSNVERPWDGVVNIYRIYNEALTDAEINQIIGMAPDERIVYEIPHNTDISVLSIDTNKHAYTMDENFTFLAKATWNPAEAGAFLLDSQSTTGSVVGARVQAALVDNNTNVIYTNQFNGGTGNNGSGGQTSNSFSASTQHTVIYIMRNNNKSITHKIYVDGVLEYEDSRTLTAKTNTWPSTYYIGMNHGNQIRPWDGIIDLYRIYNEALSDSEINSILGLST